MALGLGLGCQSEDAQSERSGVVMSNLKDLSAQVDWAALKQSEAKANIQAQLQTVQVNAGTFTMGCAQTDASCFKSEKPSHVVQVTYPLNVMRTEVTQRLYKTVTGQNPSLFEGCGLDCPVERVSWYDAVTFANALSHALDLEPCYLLKEGKIFWSSPYCEGWRLPTEAEWEYLASTASDQSTESDQIASDLAWFGANSQGRTHPVAQKKPNALGLYDMGGNVWEWTWDWYGDYEAPDIRDPRGARTGTQRVIRGGAWLSNERNIRSTVRDAIEPEIGAGILGMRLVQVAK